MSDPRLAVAADAAVLRERLEDFTASFGLKVGEDYERLTLAKIRKRLQAPHIITTISADGYCELKVDVRQREAQVTILLPRGEECSVLYSILVAALKEALRRYPEADSWRVWAIFYQAVDENGKGDGGLSECQTWLPYWPSAQVIGDRRGARIESILGDVIRGAANGLR